MQHKASAGLQKIESPDATVELWLVDVGGSAHLAESALVLSGDEIARANRFYRAEDRARFMLTRAALRRLLADASGRRPEDLAFTIGPFGKPVLAGREDLHFNVSHSSALALIGLSPLRPIGVDIELMRENIDELALAEAFFCEDEHRFLKNLEGAAQLDAFYKIWTCKEAVLKAFGVGITAYLKDFLVELGPQRLDIRPQHNCFTPALAQVRVESLEVPAEYAATIALT